MTYSFYLTKKYTHCIQNSWSQWCPLLSANSLGRTSELCSLAIIRRRLKLGRRRALLITCLHCRTSSTIWLCRSHSSGVGPPRSQLFGLWQNLEKSSLSYHPVVAIFTTLSFSIVSVQNVFLWICCFLFCCQRLEIIFFFSLFAGGQNMFSLLLSVVRACVWSAYHISSSNLLLRIGANNFCLNLPFNLWKSSKSHHHYQPSLQKWPIPYTLHHSLPVRELKLNWSCAVIVST